MVLYKPECDSNDCKLLSGQATPSTLAKCVACGETACMWGGLLTEYHIRAINRVAKWLVRVTQQSTLCWRQLGVGRLTVDKGSS